MNYNPHMHIAGILGATVQVVQGYNSFLSVIWRNDSLNTSHTLQPTYAHTHTIGILGRTGQVQEGYDPFPCVTCRNDFLNTTHTRTYTHTHTKSGYWVQLGGCNRDMTHFYLTGINLLSICDMTQSPDEYTPLTHTQHTHSYTHS